MTTLSTYENNKAELKGSVAVEIASALGVTTDYILIGNNDVLSLMEQELLTIFRSIDNINLRKVGLDQLKCLLSINIE